MTADNMAYRNEIKYVLSEVQALVVRDRLMPFMRPDTHGETYTVSSIYLDSPSLLLFHDSDVGKMNRYKIRLRSYGRQPNGQVFLEIKTRRNRMVRKYRSAVRTNNLHSAFESGEYGRNLLVEYDNESEWENLDFFMMRCRDTDSRPVSMVRYERSAYTAIAQPDVRVTFDRNIVTYPVTDIDDMAWDDTNIERPVSDGYVIMEVKSGGALPDWLTRIVQDFQLQQRSYSKYVLCTKRLQQDGVVAAESAV